MLTDNGPCYKAHRFARLCGQLGLKHRRTRPYTPRTNGNAERFIKTAINEWAYAYTFQNSEDRTASLPAWTHQYNWHRPHASLNQLPPISRAPIEDNNLLTHHILAILSGRHFWVSLTPLIAQIFTPHSSQSNKVIKIKSKNQIIGILVIILTTAAFAQNSEIVGLFNNFAAKAGAGTPRAVEEADPALERFSQGSKESVTEALPVILHAASSPYVSVRRLAGLTLYGISNRPDGGALLSPQIAVFAPLLVDTDIPVRRIAILTIHNLHLNDSSPLLQYLNKFLAREDAVSTIGAGAATVLMEAAPNQVDSTNAVVQYMRRKDQTSQSRKDLLNAIRYVAKSHSREIGKEVAGYADDPDQQTSVLAIEILQQRGKSNVLENQQSLSRIARDASKAPNVRTAAAKALSALQ